MTTAIPNNIRSLSIIMPGIRPAKWGRVYNSICRAYKGTWELIIVSPYPLPTELEQFFNIKHVRDFGNPVRASNIGASLCENDLVTWTADDAVYLPDSLDKMVEEYQSLAAASHECVIVGKYYEGEDGTVKPLQDDSYFKVNGSTSTKLPGIPDDYWLFNIALLRRSFFDRLGYWDVRFEACPMAHTDMAIRAQKNDIKVKMCDIPILDCGHMPGTSGDHAPIHYAQITHDEPLFRHLHGGKCSLDEVPARLDRDAWKTVPSLWNRRF